MKRTKIILLAVVFVMGGGVIMAQPGPSGERGDRMRRIAEKLELTDAQKEDLRLFHEEQRPKMEAIRKDDSLSREEKREAMRPLREEHRTYMESILSPEQVAKLDEMRSKAKDRFGKRQQGPPEE